MPFDLPASLREARALTAIAAALGATMAAQFAISTVETMIVARLGAAPLAGMVLAASLLSLAFLIALGVVTAVTPLVAHAMGRGDPDDAVLTAQQGVRAGLAVALPCMTALLICAWFLRNVPAWRDAASYLAGAAWGLPAWVTYVAARCVAVATGRVRVTTIAMLVALPLDAGLAALLAYGGGGLPPLGVFGAGLAHALAGFGSLALIAWRLRRSPEDVLARAFARPFRADPARLRILLRLGVPFAIRIVLREGVLPAAALAVAPFGAAALAAHAVASRVTELAGVLAFGFGDAANMRVSRAIGEGAPEAARRSGWIALLLSTGVGLAAAAAIAAAPAALARLMLGNADPAALAAATALLPIAALLQAAEAAMAPLGGALSGLRDARGPLAIAIAGYWLLGLPAGIALAPRTTFAANGVWFGLLGGATVTGCLLLARFRARAAAACATPAGRTHTARNGG